MKQSELEATIEVWGRFCDDLRAAGAKLFRASTPDDSLTVAEGLRHLTRLTRIGIETNVEYSDARFPAIARLVDETRKFGCDIESDP